MLRCNELACPLFTVTPTLLTDRASFLHNIYLRFPPPLVLYPMAFYFAPLGAKGMLICVYVSQSSLKVCLELSIFTFVAQISLLRQTEPKLLRLVYIKRIHIFLVLAKNNNFLCFRREAVPVQLGGLPQEVRPE